MQLDTGSLIIMLVLIMISVEHQVTWAWMGLVLMLVFLVKSKGFVIMILTVLVILFVVQLGPSFTEYWWIIMVAIVGIIIFMGKNEPANPYAAYMAGMGGG